MSNLIKNLERLRTLANDLPENQKNVILESIKEIQISLRISHHVAEHVESLRQNKNMTEDDERIIHQYEAMSSKFKEQEQSDFQEFITMLKKELVQAEKARDKMKKKYLDFKKKVADAA
ncbi:hypothetical protein AWW67_02200 [Roseivirga seohaensis]|uniref:Uncharacterized protein n=1 Tax=Roseivirga seohaensis TaxID=1914963 RepID=A0A150XZ25_9BACT|nr:hypothetical protein [Roseivirga seohaensis]KYG83951.1 hypothetical protein AWW67_02200 [Roseivirga seohaensis]